MRAEEIAAGALQGPAAGEDEPEYSAHRRQINHHNTGSIANIKAAVDITDVVSRYTALQHCRGGYWFLCPLHQEKTASFKVDPARQTYHCFSCGGRGDVIDFIMAAEHLDLRHALVRLRELEGGAAPDPATLAARTADRAAAAARGALKAEHHTTLARRILAEALPLTALAARPAVAYLVERRGVPKGHALSPLVPLRYHPACPFEGERVGCIVAPVQNLAGEITAIWRIRLAKEGPMRRLGLGPSKGCLARVVDPGGSGHIAIAEGVEDALAFWVLHGVPCWAALSAGNMGVAEIPLTFSRVVVVADADPTGIKGAWKLWQRLRAEGREVRAVKPVAGKDANDVLRALEARS